MFRSEALEYLFGLPHQPIPLGRHRTRDANAATATFSGRSIIWNRLIGNGTEPKNLAWGDSAVTASANPDVNLFKPQTESRTAGTSTCITTSQLADTYQVTGTITCAVGAKTITEAALFDTTTLSPTTTLAATLAIGGLSMSIGAATGLPGSGNYYMQIENEVVLITGGQGSTLQTITRGALGSSAAGHVSGTATTLGGDGGARANFTLGGQTATVGAAQGGSCFIHADFGGIALNVNDSINFTFQDQLTAWLAWVLGAAVVQQLIAAGSTTI